MIAAGLKDGKLSDTEAAQLRREFWEARARDRKIATGKSTCPVVKFKPTRSLVLVRPNHEKH
jgi:hypothetical protein